MKAILGTAGHIDHGKSALVRALTGIEPDRLPEERERGISIELGFAHLDLPGGERVGVVDVPGHERFLRQMLAGAHGFDLVLVVVAADDGVMPQTEEHFDIVHLLGVQRAIFVITKADAVDAARVEEVREELEILAVGTPFENSPVVVVSALSGQGVEELRGVIAATLADIQPKPERGLLRIPVDRVFVMKGHGVVVTGTALAGRVATGDELRVLPRGVSARVRELQVHGAVVEAATAGQRVALNLSGPGKDDIARGDTLAGPGPDLATTRFDASVEIRPSAGKPLESHTQLRVHHGTRETMGRLMWLDGIGAVQPRSRAYAQIALAEPLVLCRGDRFVLRDQTARRTLGGGVVVLAKAERHRRSAGEVAPRLRLLAEGDEATRLHTVLALASSFAVEPVEAALGAGLTTGDVARIVRRSGDARSDVIALPGSGEPEWLIAAERASAYLKALLDAVAAYHVQHPNLPGVDLEHLRGAVVPVVDARLFRLLIERLLADAALVRRGNLVHLPAHEASLGGADSELARRVAGAIAAAGLMPPIVKDLADELRIDAKKVATVAAVLVERGELVRVAADMYYARAALDEVESRLREFLTREGEITAAGFRDLISASRKYCIPLLDYFDRAGATIRVGDVRRLRRA
ncbi:MAG: selenocysteine-specific translation elongation factor [Deltaproteobacteria bacterium]|nr:selenocysteine-specific translation elongation factor [Deltaproteobacteria bacterium]